MTTPIGGALRRARTSLASVEDKLRRSLGLAGDIGAEFKPDITPVVIADDPQRPGCNSFRGRRFAFSQTVGAVAGGAVVGVKAGVPVIITRFWTAATCAAISNLDLTLNLNAEADVTAMTALSVTFTELSLVATERAPLFVNAAIPGAGVPTGREIGRSLMLSETSQQLLILEPLYLGTGDKLILRNNANTLSWIWGFEGRVF